MERFSSAEIFIWIRRNPLKSLDSAKGIQGNPSLFPWIPLDFLGLIWPALPSPPPRALPPASSLGAAIPSNGARRAL
jgi:hypothetical protein